MSAAHDAFRIAVDERRAAGRGLPCDDDPRFISDTPDDRREVVDVCRVRCHLRALCAAAGAREKHGLWGGIDRSTPSVTKANAKKKEQAA